jgi:hypothetical protein
VRYDAVNAMLLNEFLKEHRKVEELEATVAAQQKGFASETAALTEALKAQAAQIQMLARPTTLLPRKTKMNCGRQHWSVDSASVACSVALRLAPVNVFHFAKRFPVEAVVGSLQQKNNHLQDTTLHDDQNSHHGRGRTRLPQFQRCLSR